MLFFENNGRIVALLPIFKDLYNIAYKYRTHMWVIKILMV